MPPDGPWKSSVEERWERDEREREREREKDIVLAGRTSQRVGASVVGAYGPPLLCLVKWKVISNLLLSSFATGQCKYLGCRVRARPGYDATQIHKRDASSYCCIPIIYDPRTPSPPFIPRARARVYPFHLRLLASSFGFHRPRTTPNPRARAHAPFIRPFPPPASYTGLPCRDNCGVRKPSFSHFSAADRLSTLYTVYRDGSDVADCVDCSTTVPTPFVNFCVELLVVLTIHLSTTALSLSPLTAANRSLMRNK